MFSIIRRVPFSPHPDSKLIWRAGKEDLYAFPYQIILWLSVTKGRQIAGLNTRLFPVLLDTGFNHNLLITPGHLWELARLRPTDLSQSIGSIKAPQTGKVIGRLYDAQLWLHRNKSGRRDELVERRPFPLNIDNGIAVSLKPNFPRLPLLGMRAFDPQALRVIIDWSTFHVSIGRSLWSLVSSRPEPTRPGLFSSGIAC